METNAYTLTAPEDDFAANKLSGSRNTNDIVAAMLLQVAHCDWEVNSAQKEKLIEILAARSELDAGQANELFSAASFLLHFYVADGFNRLLRHSKRGFTYGQKSTIIGLMEELAYMNGPPNRRQKNLIERTIRNLG